MRFRIPKDAVQEYRTIPPGTYTFKLVKAMGPNSRDVNLKDGTVKKINLDFRVGAVVIGGSEDGQWAWDNVDFDGFAGHRSPYHGQNPITSGLSLACAIDNKKIDPETEIDWPEGYYGKEFMAEIEHQTGNERVFTKFRNFRTKAATAAGFKPPAA